MTAIRLALAAVLLALLGCGGSNKLSVSGRVTFDKQDVADGKILFEAEDGSGFAASTDIKAGAYETKLPAGRYKVRINASREVPGAKVDPAMGAVPRHDYIPTKYNADTKLSAEVKAGGDNKFDYPLVP